ncbi:MAG: restriction endonuclease [Candidatus Dadabacteria bacterium]|nr:restriction endonuclease [Candidatus Dadabacteria bacterium]MYE60781.1 restriction endonuclease [Candidatus Dadabacteria bacterium]
MSLSLLTDAGFDIIHKNHALAVLARDFPVPFKELCEVLTGIRIADVELIQGGGGEASSTQRLRRDLTNKNWEKRRITIRKTVDELEKFSVTHEIDHVRRTENGTIALEIEWNNKDPFFDRDLESFQRIHKDGVISAGVIVTRGKSLQDSLVKIVADCASRYNIRGFEDLSVFGVSPTKRQRDMVKTTGDDFIKDWAPVFVRDKFGRATTHWDKLQDRIERGVGNPCPLLLIGIPASVVYEGEL